MKRLKHLIDQYRGLSKTAYVLFFARLVTSMGAFIFPMLTLILTVKLGYTKTYAGFLMTIVSVLMLVANLIGGKIADKYNKKKIIIILDVISVLFFYACAIVQPREMMIYFLVVSGFFATMEGPAFDALLAEATLPAEREKVFSLAYIGFNLGFAFGAAMAGLLFTNYLSLAFILDGTTTIISTFMIIFMVKSYHQEEIKEEDRNEYEDHMDEKESIFKVLRQRKSVIYFILISSIGAFIYQQWNFTLPVYMNHIFGEVDGTKFYGFVASANGLVVILATPIVTHLLRKKFELQKLALGGFLMGLSFLIILWPKYLFLFFLFITIFTVAEAINTIGNSPYMSRRVPGSHRGRLTSIAFLGFFIGGNLGPLVSGYVIDHYGYQTILWIVFVLGMIVSVLFMMNDRYDRLIFPKLYMNPPSMIQTSLMKDIEESLDS
jgi:MFS family permease